MSLYTIVFTSITTGLEEGRTLEATEPTADECHALAALGIAVTIISERR